MKKLSLIILGLLPIVGVHAQKIELGGGLGLMHYKGDISPSFHPGFARPGGQLFFRYNGTQAVSLRVAVLLGTIFADEKQLKDPFQQARGLSFRSRVSEASADIEYNFLNYRHSNLKRAGNWTPYVFGGLALFKFSPNQPPVTQYKTTGMAIPFGAGIKWQLGSPWSLNVEFGTRKTFTDYLDNLGATIDPANKLAQGDPTHKDFYYYTSISLSYTFYRIVCP